MELKMDAYTFVSIGIICITLYNILKLFIMANTIKKGYEKGVKPSDYAKVNIKQTTKKKKEEK